MDDGRAEEERRPDDEDRARQQAGAATACADERTGSGTVIDGHSVLDIILGYVRGW
jgi:adenylate kinase